jgi:rubrerythrin
MDLKGSRTEANLKAAFAGESQARNKYSYYASQAKKEGYNQIADIFEESANNEKEHAKIWFKLLQDGEKIPETFQNLKDAAGGENFEYTRMYPEFAKEAKEEGFTKIAALFELVAKIEREHEQRYVRLIENLSEGKIFKKDSEAKWICANCGHELKSEKAPELCAVCHHPKAYFKVKDESYM